MISDQDIWRAAAAMMKRYGPDAGMEAAKLAKEHLDIGDYDGAIVWHRIGLVAQRFQTLKPGKGARRH